MQPHWLPIMSSGWRRVLQELHSAFRSSHIGPYRIAFLFLESLNTAMCFALEHKLSTHASTGQDLEEGVVWLEGPSLFNTAVGMLW